MTVPAAPQPQPELLAPERDELPRELFSDGDRELAADLLFAELTEPKVADLGVSA